MAAATSRLPMAAAAAAPFLHQPSQPVAEGIAESIRELEEIIRRQQQQHCGLGFVLAGGDLAPSSTPTTSGFDVVAAPPPPPPSPPALSGSGPLPQLPLNIEHLLPPQRATRNIPLYADKMKGCRTVAQQAKSFAEIALEHYNKTKKIKYELVEATRGNFIQGLDRRGYGHVNFTARRNREGSVEQIFFAELYYCGRKRTKAGFTVICCVPLGLDFTVGQRGVQRSYVKPLRKDRDFSYCYACGETMKHPRGDLFVAGHSAIRCAYALT
uniref:DUF3615 domain-containing protein n=1 Tax=Oryza barthii TaxID=65489 RepID=A0A0D3HPM9_9ORYZ